MMEDRIMNEVRNTLYEECIEKRNMSVREILYYQNYMERWEGK